MNGAMKIIAVRSEVFDVACRSVMRRGELLCLHHYRIHFSFQRWSPEGLLKRLLARTLLIHRSRQPIISRAGSIPSVSSPT